MKAYKRIDFSARAIQLAAGVLNSEGIRYSVNAKGVIKLHDEKPSKVAALLNNDKAFSSIAKAEVDGSDVKIV